MIEKLTAYDVDMKIEHYNHITSHHTIYLKDNRTSSVSDQNRRGLIRSKT